MYSNFLRPKCCDMIPTLTDEYVLKYEVMVENQLVTEFQMPRRSGDLVETGQQSNHTESGWRNSGEKIVGELTPQDRIVFNWLLFDVFEEIHEADLKGLRKFLSEHESNDRVREATKRPSSVSLAFVYLVSDELRAWGSGLMMNISASEKNRAHSRDTRRAQLQEAIRLADPETSCSVFAGRPALGADIECADTAAAVLENSHKWLSI